MTSYEVVMVTDAGKLYVRTEKVATAEAARALAEQAEPQAKVVSVKEL